MKSLKLTTIIILTFAANVFSHGLSRSECYYVVPSEDPNPKVPPEWRWTPYPCNNATYTLGSGSGGYTTFGACGTNPDTGGTCGPGIKSAAE